MIRIAIGLILACTLVSGSFEAIAHNQHEQRSTGLLDEIRGILIDVSEDSYYQGELSVLRFAANEIQRNSWGNKCYE